MGVMDRHPLLGRMKMQPWSSVAIGAFMNMVLILIASDTIQIFISEAAGQIISLGDIFFFGVIEGAIIGFLIDHMVTRKFGVGRQLLSGK